MDYQNETQQCIVILNKNLDIDSIQNQKEVLSKVLTFNKPIIFRANEVVKVDTAALQLLLSFILAAKNKKIKWEWQEPSFPLIHVANSLGMGTLLRLPEK